VAAVMQAIPLRGGDGFQAVEESDVGHPPRIRQSAADVAAFRTRMPYGKTSTIAIYRDEKNTQSDAEVILESSFAARHRTFPGDRLRECPLHARRRWEAT